jgi:amidohydrolase
LILDIADAGYTAVMDSYYARTPDDDRLVVELRRDLHMHPELAWEEVRTARRIAELTGEAGLEVREGIAKTGVVAVLRGGGASPTSGRRTMLIRADMDALPINETTTGRAYASTIPGKMHACGHDGHVAMAVTAARVLARGRDRLPGDVVFAFQPAEETDGGAAQMIAAGALVDPKVDAAIGIHLANTIPVGQVAAQPGPVTAATDGFIITIQGKGGHAARPHLSVDPIAIAAQVIPSLHILLTREKSPAQPGVLTIGAIHAGTVGNVIADACELRGTLRTYDPVVRAHLRRRVEEVATGIAIANRGTAKVEWDGGAYPPSVNDAHVTSIVRRVAADVVGDANVVVHEASLGGDDMAYFLEAVPGCYFRVGSANVAKGIDGPGHSPRFDIDEDCLPIGVDVLVGTTVTYLSGE